MRASERERALESMREMEAKTKCERNKNER